MQLPVMPPVAPMLAKAVAAVPDQPDDEPIWSFEPKWDGFRRCSSGTATRWRSGPGWEGPGPVLPGDRGGGQGRTPRQSGPRW